MKNNLKHYTHQVDSYNQWQFKTLRRTYGWDGQGKYWALCDIIAGCGGCILNLTAKHNLCTTAVELGFMPAELPAFIDFLVHEAGLLIEQDGGYTTETMQEALAKANRVRTYDRVRKQKAEIDSKDAGNKAVDDKVDNIHVSSKEAGSKEIVEEMNNSCMENENSITGDGNSVAQIAVSIQEKQQIKLNKIKQNKSKGNKSIAKNIVLISTSSCPRYVGKNKFQNHGNGAITRKQRLNAQQRHVARANKHGPGQYYSHSTLLTNTC